MRQTVYGSFASPEMAQKALGALLDHGVRSQDVSIIVNEGHGQSGKIDGHRTVEVRDTAEKGITTTTADDATSVMGVGAAAGLGIGAIAGLASLFIPGVGLVIGGGALATALAGAAGTTVAGAVSMGAYGYLKDQGVHEDVAHIYDQSIEEGGAVLATDVPSGDVNEMSVRSVMTKYGATHLDTYTNRAQAAPVESTTDRGTLL